MSAKSIGSKLFELIFAIALISNALAIPNRSVRLRAKSTNARKPIWQDIKRCGRRPLWNESDITHSMHTRIIGGKLASLGQFPSFVKLVGTKMKMDWCAGVIVDEDLIITAAHCLLPIQNLAELKVVAGIVENQDNDQETEQVLTIKSVCYHAQMSETRRANTHDLATIRLSGRFFFNDFVQPACLSIRSKPTDGFRINQTKPELFIHSGWGATYESKNNLTGQDLLDEMNLLAEIDPEAFIASFKPSKFLKYHTLEQLDGCIPNEITGIRYMRAIDSLNAWQGDSGSPVYYERNIDGKVVHFAAAIVSGGINDIANPNRQLFLSDFELQATGLAHIISQHDICAKKQVLKTIPDYVENNI